MKFPVQFGSLRGDSRFLNNSHDLRISLYQDYTGMASLDLISELYVMQTSHWNIVIYCIFHNTSVFLTPLNG